MRFELPAADSLSTSPILRMVISVQALPHFCGKGVKPCRFADQPNGACHSTGLVAITRTGLVASDRIRWSRASKKVASHCVQAFTGVHASDETSHFPLSLKLGNGAARTWHAGLSRDPQCAAKAIPQGRGGARLLSISAAANAGVARSPSGDENRNREILPQAFSREA